jgi:apolipoprotein N-acyltransferase
LKAGKLRLSTFICYEIVFPEQVRGSLQHANAILTITNDGWFGHSIAQAQHLEMAQMRALETGRFVIFATDNGQTAMINAAGKITATIPPYKTGTLTQDVQPMEGLTPWVRLGFDPVLLMLFGLLTVAIIHHRK